MTRTVDSGCGAAFRNGKVGGGLWAELTEPWFVGDMHNAVFDAYQRSRPRPYHPAPVRIVDIDEASLARLGQWPWPRNKVARLAYGVLAMALEAHPHVASDPSTGRLRAVASIKDACPTRFGAKSSAASRRDDRSRPDISY